MEDGDTIDCGEPGEMVTLCGHGKSWKRMIAQL